MDSIIKILSLLEPHERRRLIPVTAAVLGASLFELVSVGSLGPFMALVVDPAAIEQQPLLGFVFRFFGFTDRKYVLVFLGVSVFVLVLISTAFRMVVMYIVCRYSANRRYSLGLKLFKLYLYQPYRYFLNHNTSELSKAILAEVDEVISGVLLPAMNIFVHGILTLILFVFIVILNPLITAAALVIFGTAYGALYLKIRKKLAHSGLEIWEADSIRYKITSEAFGGIKDVKIMGKEPFFIKSYAEGVGKSTSARAVNQILSSIPPQAMQALAIGFTVAMVVVSLLAYDSFLQIMPLLAVYAFAILRIVPGFQGVFYNVTQIRFYRHAINTLHHDMTKLVLPPAASAAETKDFSGAINIKKIEFTYAGTKNKVLKEVTLQIPQNTTMGLVGATGCGKTTLVDVIMGLLPPDSGEVCADNDPVVFPLPCGDEYDLAPWQRNFGYVPQQIFLSDDTVAANIAFGIPVDMRDMDAVQRAAKTANLHDFIMTGLPLRYDTPVGERGIRLSGGQRQRIGIARSLYHDPAILVLDEATSALDSITEDAVMDAIHNLIHSKTIIIIAHRISTVRECDMICLMEDGRITARGTYDELMASNAQFRSMAKVKK